LDRPKPPCLAIGGKLLPRAVRDILNRSEAGVMTPETAVAAITSTGARAFPRQIAEPTIPNLLFLAHNGIPSGVRVPSLGSIA